MKKFSVYGVARQIFDRPNNRTYILKDFPEQGTECKWTSKEDIVLGLLQNEDAQKEILRRIKESDIEAHRKGLDKIVKAESVPELED